MQAVAQGSTLLAAPAKRAPAARRPACRAVCKESEEQCSSSVQGRRQVLAALAAAAAGLAARPAAAASDFVQTPSGLLVQDIT